MESTNESTHYKYCKLCNFVAYNGLHQITASWYSDSGSHYKSCAMCGYVTQRGIHYSSSWIATQYKHCKECSVCGVVFSDDEHSFGSIFEITTTTHTAECLICGEHITQPHELDAHGICIVCDSDMHVYNIEDAPVTE